MAVKTIVTCDLCGTEIKEGTQVIYLSAARLDARGIAVAKFDASEFCSHSCAVNAVNGLLNGKA